MRAERDLLAEADSPWVVKLHLGFQDETFLYMLMEYLPGGDLMTSLIHYEIFSEDVTRFYIAEILLAIEAVHKLGFIHRYVFTFAEIFACTMLLLSVAWIVLPSLSLMSSVTFPLPIYANTFLKL